MVPTPVFESYWRFAAERQAIYFRRMTDLVGPWTSDPILRPFASPMRIAQAIA